MSDASTFKHGLQCTLEGVYKAGLILELNSIIQRPRSSSLATHRQNGTTRHLYTELHLLSRSSALSPNTYLSTARYGNFV